MLQEKPKLVHIKGIRDGLLVTLADGNWLELQEALLKNIQDQAAFFKGARMALDVGNQVLHAVELGSLRDRLSDNGVTLWAVLSNSPLTEQTSQVLGLATRLFTPRPEKAGKLPVQNGEGDPAVIVHKTLRSGTRIVHPGSVVVIGDPSGGCACSRESSHASKIFPTRRHSSGERRFEERARCPSRAYNRNSAPFSMSNRAPLKSSSPGDATSSSPDVRVPGSSRE